jgi:hypothetical protein
VIVVIEEENAGGVERSRGEFLAGVIRDLGEPSVPESAYKPVGERCSEEFDIDLPCRLHHIYLH